MKKYLAITVLMLLLATPVQAKESCSTVLCMAGMLQGVGVVSACTGFVQDYFDIIMFNGHGGISLNKTFKARGKFLGKCTSAGNWPKMINSQYGRQLGF
ncbi:TrbM/KikA/MpfK family conjugal transfer protein [Nitrosomonas aestuarii]|uniref:TrbM/KikA/MpfK family conjugal transfer protein n=1 Tax=Nitrosomonas aestuarii TaxID=52441 RepID=UPI000D3036A0|nr:TrbM/KikA/MpfK family conjugal transfer protein [Nitrosomonas aestuarii]PTN08247.1 TrbM protein [Nitrosomonas aestuarii]